MEPLSIIFGTVILSSRVLSVGLDIGTHMTRLEYSG